MAENEAAFPAVVYGNYIAHGMTLRDYFAAKAIDIAFRFYDDGYCGTLGDDSPSTRVAQVAYEIADAMLAQRSK
jgi:hypothetical protein